MAFGHLVNKFRILSGKINDLLERVSAILMASAARLHIHNFIIQRDGPSNFKNKDHNTNTMSFSFSALIYNGRTKSGLCVWGVLGCPQNEPAQYWSGGRAILLLPLVFVGIFLFVVQKLY